LDSHKASSSAGVHSGKRSQDNACVMIQGDLLAGRIWFYSTLVFKVPVASLGEDVKYTFVFRIGAWAEIF
jgi:hypothetical protein